MANKPEPAKDPRPKGTQKGVVHREGLKISPTIVIDKKKKR